MRNVLLLTTFLIATVPGAVGAQEPPVVEPGVSVNVPLVDEGTIDVDGDLADWSTFSSVTTDSGPILPEAGLEASEVQWKIVADSSSIYFSATIVDGIIVAGQHGENFWNEDSLELYLNLSDDVNATSYGPGIAQITLSPIDIGATDPGDLTLSGNNVQTMDVTGLVFATDGGWGVEIAVDVAGVMTPEHLQSFGLQVQANGSNGGDRDTKLSWSVADVDDTSFQDPSVFGTGIFFMEEQTAVIAEVPDSVVADDQAPSETSVVATDEPTIADEPDEDRTLLIAAVISAASIMIGGLWFDRRRKASDANLSRDRSY